jgi:hypothetical protein
MTHPKAWQPLMGSFDIAPTGILFKGGQFKDSEDKENPATGFAVCDLRFAGGAISVNATPLTEVGFEHATHAENANIQIIIPHDAGTGEMLTAGLQGIGNDARFVFSVFGDAGPGASRAWSTLASSTFAERRPNLPVRLRVESRGSILDLFADDVHVLRHVVTGQIPTGACGLLARSWSPIRFEDFSVNGVEKQGFVVMQFTEPYNDLYKEVIQPVAKECGVRTTRSDEVTGPGMILADIIREIHESDLIIAEITPANPNVFYEVGYAHALRKPTILIAEKGRQLPFDLSPFRTLFYDNSIIGKHRIEEGLRSHIRAIFSS